MSICWVGAIISSAVAFDFLGAGAFLRILSSASLLFALKSGCLNSQAYDTINPRDECIHHCQLTPGPYGDWPLSSLFCRTLWKSYLFNCRTKLAKLLCLKCLGRMCLVNFSFYSQVSRMQFYISLRGPTSRTTKLSAWSPHLTTLSS